MTHCDAGLIPREPCFDISWIHTPPPDEYLDAQWTVHEHGSTLTSNTTTTLQPFLRLHMSLSPSKTSKQLFVLLCSSRAHGDGSDPPPLCLSTVNEPPLLNTSIYPYIFEFLFTFITTVSDFPLPVSLQIFQHFFCPNFQLSMWNIIYHWFRPHWMTLNLDSETIPTIFGYFSTVRYELSMLSFLYCWEFFNCFNISLSNTPDLIIVIYCSSWFELCDRGILTLLLIDLQVWTLLLYYCYQY